MATTGIIDGTLVTLKIGASAIAHGTALNEDGTMGTRNITTKDTASGTEYKATRTDATVSFEGMIAFDAVTGYSTVRTAYEAGTENALSWGTFVSGDPEYSASGIITSLSSQYPLDDNAAFDVTFQITGAITTGTTV
jgi:hypothetical protein